jgi:hypothetical protein
LNNFSIKSGSNRSGKALLSDKITKNSGLKSISELQKKEY